MIKITSKDEGTKIAMSCEIKGSGIDIVEEAFAIVTALPKRLKEISPVIYHAFMYKNLEVEDEDLEEESDGLN